MFIFHLVPVRLDDWIALLRCLSFLALVDSLKSVGIFRIKIDTTGKLINIMLKTCLLPLFYLSKCCNGLMTNMKLLKRLIMEINNNLLSSCLVAFINKKLYKLGLVEITDNSDLLTFLNINSRSCDQSSIFT